MSILGNNSNMGTPFFHEFKKQASFFLKDKIRTARLALTDVTPAELLTEEATNENPWAPPPDTKTMGLISRAAFEIDDYWRIVEILHKRLQRFDRNNWRASYKALILLEHLLTHGPESVAEEFQSDMDVVKQMESFQYIDERGFNWGVNVKKKSERILKLLEKGPLLKEERHRARKVTRGIQGFGSFSQQSSTADGSFRESSFATFGRCNSDSVNHDEQSNRFFSEGFTADWTTTTNTTQTQDHEICKPTIPDERTKDPNSWNGSNEGRVIKKSGFRSSSKENMIPRNQLVPVGIHERDPLRESKPLLGCQKEEPRTELFIDDDIHSTILSIKIIHPYSANKQHSSSTSPLSCKEVNRRFIELYAKQTVCLLM